MKLEEFIENMNESLNPYFSNLSFYKAAKNHYPELKRIIMKFLQQKRVKLTKEYDFQDDPDVDFNDLSTLKNKKNSILKKMNRIEKGKNFFSATKEYSDTRISFPKIIYKGFIIDITVQTNENFFEDGHDLNIKIKEEQNAKDYSPTKDFKEKIDLMQGTLVVLEKIWSIVNEKIENYHSIETKKESYRYKEGSPSLIRKTFEYTIGKVIKRKKGEVSIVDTDDKSPIDFGLQELSSKKETSSVGFAENASFKITIKVKGFGPDAAWVKNKYPNIEESFKKYLASGGSNRNISDVFGSKKLIGEEHDVAISRFEVFCDRVSKLGYYPKEYHSSYKRGDPDEISFEYGGDDFKKKMNLETSRLKIKNHLKKVMSRFYNEYVRVSDIDRVFNSKLSDELCSGIESTLSPYKKEIDMERLIKELDKYSKFINLESNHRLIKAVFRRVQEN